MVRLEVYFRFRSVCGMPGFNSSMVRLEDYPLPFEVARTLVSIPVWYDWKSIGQKQNIADTTFQFQYGTIGSNRGDVLPVELSRFNSSMVRLEGFLNS